MVHYIVHQEDLYAKTVSLNNVMSVLMKIVNKLQSHGLKQDNLKASYKIWCLSRGRVLSRFCDLLEEIILFLDMNGEPVAELSDIKWKCDLAFMADITKHLNHLNETFRKGKTD